MGSWPALFMFLACAVGRRADGDRYMAQGRYPAAARAYEDVLVHRSRNRHALLGQAQALLAADRPEQALAPAQRAAEQGWPEGQALYAEALIRTGQAEAALALLTDPTAVPQGNRLLAEARLSLGDHNGALSAALDSFDRALIAWCALRAGQRDAASSTAQAALSDPPEDAERRAEMAGVLLSLGVESAVEIPDDAVTRWWAEAARLQQLGDIEATVRLLSRLTVSRPQDTRYSATLGGLWLQLGEPELARRALEDALDIDPNQPQAWVGLALSCEAIAQHECAAMAWENRLRYGESLPDNWLLAARAWQQAGDMDRQLSLLQRAVRTRPTDPDILTAMSQAQRFHGDFEAALGFAQRAWELDPDNPDRMWNLIELFRAWGDEASAMRMLELGRRNHPQDNRFRTGR